MGDITLNGTCAVVGNSPIILSTSHGEEIDSHDHVIRCNKAPTKGIEKHTGKRTTIRFINIWIAKTILDTNSLPGKFTRKRSNWKNLNLHDILQDEMLILKDSEPSCDEVKRKIGNKHRVDSLTSEYLSEMKKLSNSTNPTVGFCAVVWASRIFNTVKCYGFDFYAKSEPKRIDYHYFEDVCGYNGHKWHNFSREKSYLYSLSNVTFVDGIKPFDG